jgi:predicted restriction endonuclease
MPDGKSIQCRKCNSKNATARKKEFRTRGRVEVLKGYGNRCALCGFSDTRALVIDHVNDNGAEERRNEKTEKFYRRIIANNFPPEYQVLCSNCNSIKEFERRRRIMC